MKRNILLNPGPATTSENVKMAQVVPDICPREKEFSDLIKFVRTNLLKIVNADPEKYSCVLFGGSGSLVIESVISSVVPQNGKLLIINNGAYGSRQKQVAEIHNIPYFEWKLDQTKLPDLKELEKIIDYDNFTHISFVHHETTTGLLNPLKEITELAKSKGLDVFVDTVSSFAGLPIDLQKLDVDYIISTSNKCVQGMAGIAFVIGKKNKIEESQNITKRSLYASLYDQYKYMNDKGQFRFTPPVQTMYSLKQAIIEFFDEGGIEARHKRYSNNWEILLQGINDLGLESLIPREDQSKILISIKYPCNDFDFNTLHDSLYEKGYTIYPGKLGDLDTFRLSTLGDLYSKDMINFLAELKTILLEMGINLEKKKFDWHNVWEKKGNLDTNNLKELDGFENVKETPQELANKISTVLEIKSNDKVLEVGCGAGMIAQHLDCDYVGIDYSRSLVKKHIQILNNPVLVAEANYLPFADNYFDKVFAYSIFQYFSDKDYANQVISEMKRVSKNLVFIGDLVEKSFRKEHLCFSRNELGGEVTDGYHNLDRFNILLRKIN